MKAIGYTENHPIDHPDALLMREVPEPEPGERDLLVRVTALSVNPVDTKVRGGRPAAPFDFRILGWDACGVVEALGGRVEGFAVGDRVYYAGQIDRPGSYAERQAVDARLAAKAPTSLSDAEAAALPLTSLTAWEALFERLGYTPEPSEFNRTHPLLVINGAGGVGSIALQLAHRAGIPTTATASRAQSQDWCRQNGADRVIPHSQLDNWPDEAFARILCCHNTDDYFERMTGLIAPQGLICALAGTARNHNLMPLMNKSAGFVWEYMFTRGLHQTDDMVEQSRILTRIADGIDTGELRSTLTETHHGFNVDTLRAMHHRQESGGLIGKQSLVL